jgi:hypothetical protein
VTHTEPMPNSKRRNEELTSIAYYLLVRTETPPTLKNMEDVVRWVVEHDRLESLTLNKLTEQFVVHQAENFFMGLRGSRSPVAPPLREVFRDPHRSYD